jgi:aerobic carbon-monoxide dehydrogenase medium subunit
MLVAYGEGARPYAGGTELLLAMKHAGLRYDRLVDLKTILGLDGIEQSGGDLRIGALATHRTLEKSPLVQEKLPVLAALEAHVANARVRASGTFGGNLCFAEPHSDPATLLLCLDARLHVVGPEGSRNLPLNEFILGPYEVVLDEGELLEAVTIPIPGPEQRAAYRKFQVRERPMLGLALAFDLSDGHIANPRVAIGSASPTPRRAAAAEALLSGSRQAVDQRLDEAADAVADEAELLDDLDGGTDYKRHLIHVLLGQVYDGALNGRPG